MSLDLGITHMTDHLRRENQERVGALLHTKAVRIIGHIPLEVRDAGVSQDVKEITDHLVADKGPSGHMIWWWVLMVMIGG